MLCQPAQREQRQEEYARNADRHFGLVPVRVAIEARGAVEGVSTLVTMLIGQLRLVVVAIRTGEHTVVVRVGVALCTCVPFTLVVPAVNGEVVLVMIECGWHPS